MRTEELLADIRNYLDITYNNPDLDAKLDQIIGRGMAYLDDLAGGKQDYSIESMPRALLFDYCRYAINNALEYFEHNFSSALIALRIGVQTHDYAKQQGYI